MNQMESQKVLHPVENLTHLYRARKYWDGAELVRSTYKLIDRFDLYPEDYNETSSKFIREIKAQTYLHQGWNTFYEPCPVIKTTPMEVIVTSQNMPPDILAQFPDFKAGGSFHINKAKLQRDGRALHTRHGEYFYIAVPNVAIALDESKELLEVAS